MRGWIAGFHPARVEAVGIALLLVGAVWEFTVMRQTAGEVARSSQVNTHRQLQYIFEEVASGNPKKYYNDYKYQFEELEKAPEIEKALDWHNNEFVTQIRFVFIVLGGMMTFAGKWLAGSKK